MESKQRDIDKMGVPLGEIFHALSQELQWIYVVWQEYIELFGTKPSRIDLLNKAASFFFYLNERTLWDEVLLGLARITDPCKSCGKQNLTIQQLPLLVDPHIRSEVSSLVEVALDKSSFCRDLRHQYLAHRDLHAALKKTAKPPVSASRHMIEEALSAIAATLNEAYGYYHDAEFVYDDVVINDGARHLLFLLDDGLKMQEARRKRLKAGRPLPGDFGPRKL